MCGVSRREVLALLGAALLLAGAWPSGSARPGGTPLVPRWASQGFIVYKCRDSLCLVRPDRSGRRYALSAAHGAPPRPEWDPALSADGRFLAFRGYYSLRDGGYALYVASTSGCTWHRVTRSIAGHPSWSPDGGWVAYDTSGAGQIWKVRAHGGRPVQLTRRRRVGDASPAWSPNGRLIAFVRSVRGRGQIWLMRSDGRDAHLLHADRRFDDEEPTWAHEGTRIAFSAVHGGRSRIEVMSASGGHARTLTGSRIEGWNPVWLPHDAGIAFLGSFNSYGKGNLFVMRSDGHALHQLTHWPLSAQTPQFAWTGAPLPHGCS